MNYDMPRVTKWVRANRISLINVAKTEILIRENNHNKQMNFRINVQKIKTKKQTKYLGIILD